MSGEGRQLIATTGSGYRLEVAAEVVDAVRFERLADEGRRMLGDGMAEAAAVTLREALGLWRGPALEDFDDDFAVVIASDWRSCAPRRWSCGSTPTWRWVDMNRWPRSWRR